MRGLPWVLFLEDAEGETECYVAQKRGKGAKPVLRAIHPDNAMTFPTAQAARDFASAHATEIMPARGESPERANLTNWKVGRR